MVVEPLSSKLGDLRSRLMPPAPPVEPEKRVKPQPLQKIAKIAKRELDPRLLRHWPRYLVQVGWRACTSMSTLRNAKFNDLISGLVESCLLFTFASVFASSIFSEVGVEFVALGTGCTLITTIIIQSTFTLFSDCAITVGGPEITPTIFLTTMAGIARRSMQARTSTASPTAPHRLLSDSAAAPSSSTVAPENLLTTVLAVIIISSVVFGLFIYTLGRFKISKIIRLIPACVLSGYMASIGYLVLVKSMSTSMPHQVFDDGPGNAMWWAYFIPALAVGVLMYLQRRWKLGNPTIILPILLFTPIILFYISVYGSGSDIVRAAEDGWLFPAFPTGLFYNQLVYSYGKSASVDWQAVGETVPTMITMFFVVTLEAIMKQASTKKLLKAFDMRVDHELMLIGKANIVTGMVAGVIGYPQPKLTYINYSVVRNTVSRVPGIIIICIAAIIFFSGFPLINYLPRFWLSGVLIFAASGFLVENLWDGFFTYTHKEYLVIAVIVIVNATLQMAWAVVAGLILSALLFALAYSRQNLIKAVISGGEWRSNILRDIRTEVKLEHLGQRALIIQLHRFVFFGNASYLNEVVMGLIKGQQTAPQQNRALYFVFDWSRVENVDITASTVIFELVSKVGAEGRIVLFTGLDSKMKRKLAESLKQIHNVAFTVLPDSGPTQRCFNTLDEAMEFVEDALLQHAAEIRRMWFARYQSLDDFHVRAQFKNHYEFWEQLDYFQQYVQVPKGWSLQRMGERDENLYVLKEGSLSLLGGNVCVQRIKSGAFVNEGALCNQQPALHSVVADVDSIVLALSNKEQHNLELEKPAAMFDLHRMVEEHLVRVKRKNTARLDVMNWWEQQLKASAAAATALAEDDDQVTDHGDEQEQDEQHMDLEAQNTPILTRLSPPAPSMLRQLSSPFALKRQASIGVEGATTTQAATDEAADFLLLTEQMKENVVMGDDDLFDKIRDDAGEEEGLRLARKLKRRTSSVVQLNPIKGLKLLKSDEVVAAVARRMALKEGVDYSGPEIYYHLCPMFAAHARAVFGAKANRNIETDQLQLPRSLLKQTLNQIGVCYHADACHAILFPELLTEQPLENDDVVTLPQFLDLVVQLSMPALPVGTVRKLFAFFKQATRITEVELKQLLPYTSPLTVSKFVNMWDEDRTRTVDFSSLCSAMAQHLNEISVNALVAEDWKEISNGAECVYAADIARALDIPVEQAQEMVWEADYLGNDSLSLNVLLEALSL